VRVVEKAKRERQRTSVGLHVRAMGFLDRFKGLFSSPSSSNDKNHKVLRKNTSKFVGTNSSHNGERAAIESSAVQRSDGAIRTGWARMRGRRNYNEDQVHCKFATIEEEPEIGEVACCGVFDGHGGPRASEYVQMHLFENILGSEKFPADIFKAIEDGFQATDHEYLRIDKKFHHDDGTTASILLVVGTSLYTAHVGDSRAVMGTVRSDGTVTATPLTEDHKPQLPSERQRVESTGGTVIFAGTWRLSGVLAISRAFGNRMLKRWVVAHPEIREDRLTKKTKCLIVASDGLWDALTDQEAIDEVMKYTDPEAAARAVITVAYDRGSYDNISAIVAYVDFSGLEEEEGEGGVVETPNASVRPPRRTHDATTTSKALNTGFFS